MLCATEHGIAQRGLRIFVELGSALMVKHISLDFELASTLDLTDVGTHEWTTHKDTVPILCGFALDHDEPECIVLDNIDRTLEAKLLDAVAQGGEIHAWNANFEWNVWNNICVPRFAWPQLQIERYYCTMCAAACAGLPMSLDQAGLAVGSTHVKDKTGHFTMLRMSRPRHVDKITKAIRWWHEEDPAKLQSLIVYCLDDVRAERDVNLRIPRMTLRERQIWLADQRMNRRGLPVDPKLLEAMRELTLQELLRLSGEINRLTQNYVTSSTQNARLLTWAQLRGYPHQTLERETLLDFIHSDSFDALDPDAQEVLTLRAESAKTSTTKLLAVQNYTSRDGYARNMIQYGAAVRTLRWGGRGPQIQNFPRPVIDEANIEPAINEMIGGMDAEGLRILYGNPLDVVSSCLRGVFKAPEGWLFAVSDYSAIEAIVLAWLSEFNSLLDVFRRKEDVYVVTAAGVGSTDRQLGKVLRLACGYGMGHVKFQETANAAPYWLDLSLGQAKSAVDKFRQSNGPIVSLWHGVENTARNAILRPADELQYKKLRFRMAKPGGRLAGSLLMTLPSGRNLVYRNVRLENGRIVFWGVDQMTRRWKELDTYGGKLVENATQAVARDLLAEAVVMLEQIHPGAALCTVHDEIIAMAPEADAPELLANMNLIMRSTPAWGAGLPLSAKGATIKRYRKL